MRTFKIPVSWELYGHIEIEAKSINDAIRIFDEQSDDISLPEGEYVDGSFNRESKDFCIEFNSNTDG